MLRGASRGRFGRRIGPTATLLLSVHDLRVGFFKTIERLVLELVFDSSRASSVCDGARVWCDCGLLWWRVVIACFESATRRVVILRGSMFVDFRLAAARSKRTAWCDVLVLLHGLLGGVGCTGGTMRGVVREDEVRGADCVVSESSLSTRSPSTGVWSWSSNS